MIHTKRSSRGAAPSKSRHATLASGAAAAASHSTAAITRNSLRGSDPPTLPPEPPPKIKSLPLPKLSSPESLSIPQFRDWKQRWTDYSAVQQLFKNPIPAQQSVLRSALDTEWTLLWASHRIPVDAEHTDHDIIVLMEQYLRERRNTLIDRQVFHRRDQAPGESIDRYYAALKVLDEACAHEADIKCQTCVEQPMCTGTCSNLECSGTLPLFHHLQDTRIRDRLFCGLLDKETRTKILAEQYTAALSLEKVLSICSAMEQSKSADASLRSQEHPNELHATSKQSTYKRQQSSKPSTPSTSSTSSTSSPSTHLNTNSSQRNWLRKQFPRNTCLRCGLIVQHTLSEPCPALDKTCTYPSCRKLGHVIGVCGTRLRNEASPTTNAVEIPSSSVPFQLMTVSTRSKLPSLPIPSTINGRTHNIPWLPDTGAELDAMGLADVQNLGPEAIRSIASPQINAVGSNGISLGPVGTIYLILTHNGREYRTTVGVYKHLSRPLLSKAGCIALGLISAEWPHVTTSALHAISPATTTRTIVHSPFQCQEQLKHSLLTHLGNAFDDSTLRPMSGPPMSIELVPGAVPFKRYRHNNIPYHWRGTVKQQLDTMVSNGIIEPVPIGEAIDWCHPMVVVPKKGSYEPRLTIDLTKLNQFVRRPAYPMRIPREAVARIPAGQKYFTTLDARHGYWQVPLDQKSSKLTTFITPWGCYRYLRNVMGLISAGDEHNRRGDEALAGIENVEKIVEDIVIYDTELPTHVKRVRQVIERCMEHGITLNAKKFNFAQPTVQWCGYILNEEGYTPAPHLIEALKNFPTPASKTDVRSFNGLVQQFGPFSHRISELAAPLRELLPAKACFTWTQAHQDAFTDIIAELSSPKILAQFQPGQPLRLETDAAQSKGLGFALWQQQSNGTWRLLQAGSRFASPAESRYSATEIELLSVVWAVKKCRLFLLGHPFELLVDHRPLVSIINSKTLDEIENPRLLRFKEKIGMYLIHATWWAGIKHTVVDVLSRHPVLPATEEETADMDVDPALIFATSLCDPETSAKFIPDHTIDGVRQAALSCPTYTKLLSYIHCGFPEKSQVTDDITPFWKIRHDLGVTDGLVFWGSRLVVPTKLRRHILHLLHSSHQGRERTLRRARQPVFWPGISNDIKNVVSTCPTCQTYLPSCAREPLQTDPPPSYPFQEVGSDLFSYAGCEYLVMVDRFSGWITLCKTGISTTTSTVINILKRFMTDTGIPELLRTDNGPQFSSYEFKQWAKQWGIHLRPSSPHYPQSNGLAESAVKVIKHLLAKTSPRGDITTDAFRLGLLELRNTPREDGRSPAQLIFGHPLRTLLPLHRSRFTSEWHQRNKSCEDKAAKLHQQQQQQYNSHARPLHRLGVGDTVVVQNHNTKRWDLVGKIIDLVNDRSYLLRTDAGRVLRRNRRYLRPCGSIEDGQSAKAPPEDKANSPPVPDSNLLLRRSPRNHPSPQFRDFRFKGGVDTGSHSVSRTNKGRSISTLQSGARRDHKEAMTQESG